VFQLLSNISQRRPAGIVQRFGAIALFLIQITPAMWAQTLAVFAADCLQRQRQENLLPQNIFQEQTVSLIIPDLGLGCGYGKRFFSGVGALRTVEKLKLLRNILMNRLKTTRTSHLDPRRELADYTDVIDNMVLAMMFLNQLGSTDAGQFALLPKVRAKIDGSGRKMLVKINGMNLQLSDFDEHFGTSAPPGVILGTGRGSTY
jgi:hypothetical protein